MADTGPETISNSSLPAESARARRAHTYSRFTTAIAVLALATVTPVALTGFALAGLGFGWALTGLSTVVQERAPEELRGRIMALWLVGFLGSRPIAAAVLGGTADALNVYVAFAVAAVSAVAVALLCRPSTMTGHLPARSGDVPATE